MFNINKFGSFISKKRKELNITQSNFADKLEKLVPFLDEKSRYIIFDKIINKKMDYKIN